MDIAGETVRLLEGLRERWIRVGAPVADGLLPGLTDDEIDATLEPTGLQLPEDLRAFWKWHNGTDPSDLRWGAGYSSHSLSAALARRDGHLLMAEKMVPFLQDFLPEDGGPASQWVPEWLPVFRGDSSTLSAECTSASGASGPIRMKDFEMFPIDFYAVRAPTFNSLLQTWTDAIDSGVWFFDPALQCFISDWDALTPEQRTASLL